MTEPSTPLLALALDPVAFGPAAATARVDPAVWLELVLSAERHGVSLVTLGDTHRAADGVPRLDALMLAAWLGARTTQIGILAAADTTVTEPYLLASQVATADFVSAGRAGWLAQVSGRPEDAAYVGPREAALGDAAWVDAAEFVEVVRALWDSWEDGAEIRDIARHRFIDSERIHHIDFAGEHLAIKGPSITPRPPQGQPPVAIEVGYARARDLAVAGADVAFLDDGVDPDALRAEAAGRGREVRLLLDRQLDTVSADDVQAALTAGFDGVRLIATALPGRLEDRLGALSGQPGQPGRPGSAGQPDRPRSEPSPTLRDQLGLARPLNRYAEVNR